MRVRTFLVWVGLSVPMWAASTSKPSACRVGVIEGELTAGKEFTHPIGNGLRVSFQPVASGWILRVVPVSGPVGAHDYAELATPPYQSVTPLSLSTDFAFRAQDAVGWNPRRFRFVTSAKSFDRLGELYGRVMSAGARPPAGLEGELSGEIAALPEGKLTIVDSKLVPGMADQWKMAGAVASRFSETAHTFLEPEDGKPSPLGRLVWVRFRVELEIPAGLRPDRTLRVMPHLCGNL